MNYTGDVMKNRKQAALKSYINYNAVKIQKVFRGYNERKNLDQFRKAFDPYTVQKLEAVALGFRTRKILRLKEAQDRINFIGDHDQSQFRDNFEDQDLMRDSRMNACKQLVQFIKA